MQVGEQVPERVLPESCLECPTRVLAQFGLSPRVVCRIPGELRGLRMSFANEEAQSAHCRFSNMLWTLWGIPKIPELARTSPDTEPAPAVDSVSPSHPRVVLKHCRSLRERR